ncbi:Na-H-Exchanger domain-containing protein [Mycena indigotica]|uniref:Na-H-Exchanger domain-containing protein n=1 Tax=Mycena indigotica TaxID=2126181 RepID=A0A8H6T2M7_9AGAR|nr:Na-H-Exchanger domain-containing protein [Mycena indigotica]KAF7309906.1 Na-H-Exchanger domain-containing protein [Mycena indigotica]
MPEFSRTIVSLFQRATAPEQASSTAVFLNPSAFNTADPLRLWIIQVGIIVATASLLSLGLRKIHQPKVISEVLGGIILGPTAFGSIPHFSQRIFPSESIPYLSLVANIGLVLFLFLVGLEIDSAIIKRNARLSASVALAGMVLPFGLGAALSHPLYEKFVDPSVKFTHFMLFTGVAYSITAFPVLCRILTELKLLDTTVGIVVLSAGVANDIIGWTLLALSVALVNAGSGLTALWILMICVGWTLFLLFPVRFALLWLARKTGSIESGPTMFFMTVTVLLVFGSAFFTDIIGVHAIFGAFVMGLVVPREGGLAIALTEKLEDLVTILFLPLASYFTLSGLNTNLKLLDNGMTWAYTIAICTLAFVGKFGGCTVAARYLAGFNWRESSTIGSLMSCKGLVELIVLNVGLSAGILSPQVFSMFVLEALLLTFMTTPLVTALYPPDKRVRASATGANFNNVNDMEERAARERWRNLHDGARTRFTFVLDKLEHLPGMMAMAQLIQPHTPPTTLTRRQSKSSSSTDSLIIQPISIEALRLMELSDRVSAVMKSSVSESLVASDPLLTIFRMFGRLHDLHVSPAISIVPFDDFGNSIAQTADSSESDMIVVPWLPFNTNTHSTVDGPNPTHGVAETSRTPGLHSNNPFDALFKSASSGVHDKSASAVHASFVRSVFMAAKTDVALWVNQASHAAGGSKQHIFLLFSGGPDDRMALEFVSQLCARNSELSATMLRLVKKEVDAPLMQTVEPAHLGEKTPEAHNLTVASVRVFVTTYSIVHFASMQANAFPDTVYGHVNTETRLQSDTADNIAWAKFAAVHPTDASLTLDSDHNTNTIEARELVSPVPLHAAIHEVNAYGQSHRHTRVLVIVGRSRRLAVEDHAGELKELGAEYGNVGAEVRKTMGDVATAFLIAGAGDGLLVLQGVNVAD